MSSSPKTRFRKKENSPHKTKDNLGKTAYPELKPKRNIPLSLASHLDAITGLKDECGTRDNLILPHLDIDGTKKASKQDKASGSRGPISAEDFGGPVLVDNPRCSLANSTKTVSEGIKEIRLEGNSGTRDNLILPHLDTDGTKTASKQDKASGSRGPNSAEDFGAPKPVGNLLANSTKTVREGIKEMRLEGNSGTRDNLILPHLDIEETKEARNHDETSGSRGLTSVEDMRRPELADNLWSPLAARKKRNLLQPDCNSKTVSHRMLDRMRRNMTDGSMELIETVSRWRVLRHHCLLYPQFHLVLRQRDLHRLSILVDLQPPVPIS
ncbi:uncharacterized protein LOC134288695 [Aedes albopictus]|uniref:Uncharacterized protein n=1 Tax=Aedes albopictus TaxID=7160 RepID=A0ABM1YX86_AEDAL